MKKTLRLGFIISSILLVFFIVFTFLITNINVKAIGPLNSNVGFSFLNEVIFKLCGTNLIFDKLSDIMLIISFLVAICFIILGICQLIKRKSFKKVDSEIYLLGFTYLFVLIAYVVFEVLTINHRPVLVDGKLEASYPSTHILITFTILSTAVFAIKKYIHKKPLKIITTFTLEIIIVLSIVFRLLSGMHWATDILGALLLATTLTSLYKSFELVIKNKREQKRTDK